MAGFNDCIRSAQRQGMLSEDEADSLIERYEEHRSARAAAGEKDPDAAAKTGLMADVEAAAARKRAVAEGSSVMAGKIRSYFETFRDLNGKVNVFEAAINLLEHFGAGAGTSSIAGRTKSYIGLAHGMLNEQLSTFRRSRLTGQRFNRPKMDDVVREALGETTGSAEAKGMANALGETFEFFRERFNKAAGFEAIGKLEGGYMPQFHNPIALLKAGFDEWRGVMLRSLDINRMRDPMTGGTLSPARLDEALKSTYDRVVTGGWDKREPSMVPFGKGAVANQHSEHRFYHFKDADTWLEYDKNFGHGDTIKAIHQHINRMARDIAAMDVLGPNPNAMMNWIKQVVTSEAGKARTGQPSLYTGLGQYVPSDKAAAYSDWRLDAMYGFLRGRATVSDKVSAGFGTVRNVLTSAQLGGASVLAATTDPLFDTAARYMAGLPMTKALGGIAHAIKSNSTREQAVRSGLILDDFLHIVGDEARIAGAQGGSEESKWLAERTVQLSGLEPITQARKHVFGLDFQGTVADFSHLNWQELGDGSRKNRYLRRALESYGITAKDWNSIRGTEQFRPNGGAGFIQPADVKNVDTKLKYLEMILGETERAVPTSTIRSKTIFTGTSPRGSWINEIVESGLQYKSFALSVTTLQLQAIKQELHQGAARGAGYAMSLLTAVTLGGALAMQIKNIIAGKDVQPMDWTTGQGIKFWIQAAQTGGGFGIAGDYLFADVNRYGGGPIATAAGPTAGLVEDILKLTGRSWQKPLEGDKTHLGREALKTAGKYVPVISTLPYTRAAYQRMLLDQLQFAVDPEAHKYFNAEKQRLRRSTGNEYFWPPGQSAPARGPQMSTAAH